MRRRNISREEHSELLRRREARRIVEEKFAMTWDDAWYDCAIAEIGGSLAACAVEVRGDPTTVFMAAYQKYAFSEDLRDKLDVDGVTTTEIAAVQNILMSAAENVPESLSANAGIPLDVSRTVIAENPGLDHRELAKAIVTRHVEKLCSNNGADFMKSVIERSLVSTRNDDESVWESWFLAELRDNFGSSENVGIRAFRENVHATDRIEATVIDAAKEVMADMEGPELGMDGP